MFDLDVTRGQHLWLDMLQCPTVSIDYTKTTLHHEKQCPRHILRTQNTHLKLL
jgi:hypothetical protein